MRDSGKAGSTASRASAMLPEIFGAATVGTAVSCAGASSSLLQAARPSPAAPTAAAPRKWRLSMSFVRINGSVFICFSLLELILQLCPAVLASEPLPTRP